MIDIQLQALANQELSIPLDGSRYVLRVKEANGGMVITVIKDDVVLVQNARIVADAFVLQTEQQQAGGGNFFMATQLEEIPYYPEFGRTQFMVYATPAEIGAA